jgi:prepilin-type processing-associated H-X9-DG protein
MKSMIDESPSPSPPRPKSRTHIVIGVLAVLGVLLVLSFLIQSFDTSSRLILQDKTCSHHIRAIGLALQNYHSIHGTFPPAYFADERGQPMHSWRVMLLPLLEDARALAFAKKYRWDEPWCSEHNLALSQDFIPEIYVCKISNNRIAGQTNFLAVTGEDTAWNRGESIRESDVTDGLAKTIAACDLSGLAVHWTEPRDVSVDQLVNIMRRRDELDAQGARPSHKNGTNFLFLDASVHGIQSNVRPETLRAMSTIAGAEEFNSPF